MAVNGVQPTKPAQAMERPSLFAVRRRQGAGGWKTEDGGSDSCRRPVGATGYACTALGVGPSSSLSLSFRKRGAVRSRAASKPLGMGV